MGALKHMVRYSASLALGTAAALAAAAAVADSPAAADTSTWKCEQCPFLQGYDARVEAGALYADGANASYGRYTGINHSSVYLDASAAGQYRRADGLYATYDLDELGLASREGYVEGGEEGLFEARLSYDGQPTRLYDFGLTPFRSLGSSSFGLPGGWVAAGNTAGMAQLAASLVPITLGYDRRTVALSGLLFAGSSWIVSGEFRRQEKVGTDFTSASFLTQALQLAEPIDYVTNSFDVAGQWAGRSASLRLSYGGSWFTDDSGALRFANPYLPFLPGATQGQLAMPPGNNLQQLAASGYVQLPWLATTLTYSASLGRLQQNAAFLPVSTLPGAAIPSPGSLDGHVHVSQYALGLAARPLPKVSVHAHATYDGRDDGTTPLTLAYVVTDTFPGGSFVTPRYSEDRVRLDGGADYAPLRWLRVGVGGELREIHYGPDQLLSWSQDAQSFGYATLTPFASLSLTLKGGDALRKTSAFDKAALPVAENPQIAAFNYAARDRTFYSVTGSWSVTPTLTWGLEGFFADDAYRLSQLGLRSSQERSAATTLAWKARDNLTLYADAGYQRFYELQSGFSGAFTAPWMASDAERFWNAGAGGEWLVSQRWKVKVDYFHAPSYTDTDVSLNGPPQPFPQNWTRFDRASLDATYVRSSALQIHLRYSYEKFDSTDWALGGVGPATVPNLLALGLQPYQHSVNFIALTASYQFGAHPAAAAAQ
jgi:MtrB/PioB family decaheme-associated outer membrane protein